MDASDFLQGRLLSFICHLVRPKLVVEIGTFTAYATGCLAEGLSPQGKIISIEQKLTLKPLITENLKILDIEDQVEMHFSPASEVLSEITEPIDLIFIDAAKHEYQNFYDLAIDKIRPGGVLIADNTLWKGRVLEDESEMDRIAKSLHLFNQRLSTDSRVEVMVLPYRDGISMIRKL